MGETEIPEALLERLRRGVPLRLTRTGVFLHDGEPVTHRGLDAALRRGLDLSDTPEPIVRIGHTWCYLEVDDCLLRARTLTVTDDLRLALSCDDGRTHLAAPEDLAEDDYGLWVAVPSDSGRPIPVRLLNAAALALEPYVEDSPDGPRLSLGQRLIPIRRQAANTPSPAAPGERSE